jgi:hypothetical protein
MKYLHLLVLNTIFFTYFSTATCELLPYRSNVPLITRLCTIEGFQWLALTLIGSAGGRECLGHQAVIAGGITVATATASLVSGLLMSKIQPFGKRIRFGTLETLTFAECVAAMCMSTTIVGQILVNSVNR